MPHKVPKKNPVGVDDKNWNKLQWFKKRQLIARIIKTNKNKSSEYLIFIEFHKKNWVDYVQGKQNRLSEIDYTVFVVVVVVVVVFCCVTSKN